MPRTKAIENMKHALDPLAYEEELAAVSPSRESIKSFWVGSSGLAVLAILACIVVFSAGKLEFWLISFLGIPKGPRYWMSCYGIDTVIGASLIPSLVLGALVPVLYWRGGLMQRFAISVVLAVTTMNLTTEVFAGAWNMKVPIRETVTILLCWIAMPMIFLWTPINTRSLRLIVASCLMLLTLCLSILSMISAPQNISLLYWESLYGAALGYALLRRNWGRVAVLEAGTTLEQIERTSSRTLLELMTVCGLACATSMYLSTTLHVGAAIQLVQAAVLGIGCILISLACIRMELSKIPIRIWKWFLIWLWMWLLLGVNSVVYLEIEDPYGTGNWLVFSSGLEPLVVIFIGSSIASLAYVGFMCLVGKWLRWCGWRMQSGFAPE